MNPRVPVIGQLDDAPRHVERLAVRANVVHTKDARARGERHDVGADRTSHALPPRTPNLPPTAPATVLPPISEPRRMGPMLGGPEPSPA